MITEVDRSAHHVEMWRRDADGVWGWQCFTCGESAGGLADLRSAEFAADEHCSPVAVKETQP